MAKQKEATAARVDSLGTKMHLAAPPNVEMVGVEGRVIRVGVGGLIELDRTSAEDRALAAQLIRHHGFTEA